MKDMSSDNHDLILRGTYMFEALKHFNWETVMLELEKQLPMLLTLLKQNCLTTSRAKVTLVLSGIKAFKIKTPAAGFSAASGIHDTCSNLAC